MKILLILLLLTEKNNIEQKKKNSKIKKTKMTDLGKYYLKKNIYPSQLDKYRLTCFSWRMESC